MALDPSIILDINTQGPDPKQVMGLYDFAQKLKQQKQVEETGNAMKAVFQSPDAIGPDGLPTTNALKQISRIDPQAGLKLYGDVARTREADLDMQIRHDEVSDRKSAKVADEVIEPAMEAYNSTLEATGNKEAAIKAGQAAASSGLDAIDKGGLHGDNEVDALRAQLSSFDPVKYDAMGMRWKDYRQTKAQAEKEKLAAQKLKQDEANQRAREAREEHHEQVQEGIERDRLNLEKRKYAREVSLDSNKPNLSPVAIEGMAEQLLSGDHSALQNIGRGKQGAADIAAVRNRVYEIAQERGLKGQDLANIDAAFKGQQAGEVALGRRGAVLEQTGEAVEALANQAKAAYAKLGRGNFVPFNKLRKMVADQTASPEQAVAFAADNAAKNAWAKAINPTGAITVENTRRADEMLSNVTSLEAHNRVLDQMILEAQTERKTTKAAKASLREPSDSEKPDPLGIR